MSFPDDYILIGDIGAAHGIKGWVRIRSFAEPREGLFLYPELLAATGSKTFELNLEKKQTQGARLLAKFKGVDDRNKAEQLTGTKLYIAKEALIPLSEDDYYWHQLVGLEVRGSDNQVLGQVKEIIETGSHDVLVLKAGKEERMIPFVLDKIVQSVDLKNGVILVNWTLDYFDES